MEQVDQSTRSPEMHFKTETCQYYYQQLPKISQLTVQIWGLEGWGGVRVGSKVWRLEMDGGCLNRPWLLGFFDPTSLFKNGCNPMKNHLKNGLSAGKRESRALDEHWILCGEAFEIWPTSRWKILSHSSSVKFL